MRDLSRFADASFDIVWRAHSINFVPDVRLVFTEVSRVLDIGGLYRLEFTNPFIHGSWRKAGPELDIFLPRLARASSGTAGQPVPRSAPPVEAAFGNFRSRSSVSPLGNLQ